MNVDERYNECVKQLISRKTAIMRSRWFGFVYSLFEKACEFHEFGQKSSEFVSKGETDFKKSKI